MDIESSLFLWRREAQLGTGPSASRRILACMMRSLCAQCAEGTPHNRKSKSCSARHMWIGFRFGISFFLPGYINGFMGVLSPNTLAAILVAANREYWRPDKTAKQTLTDPEYDATAFRLEKICSQHPQLNFVGDYNDRHNGYHVPQSA